MESGTALRLFLAIDVPDAARLGLDAAAASARALGAEVRWVRPESVHLTLVFLGERPPAHVEAIAACVAPVVAAHAPFGLHIAGMGCFPSAARPRVLWAGLGGETAALAALRRDVQDALVRAGLAEADTRFDPHLTLGRVRDEVGPAPRAALGRAWLALPLPDLPAIPVRDVRLMRSELGRDGARYTVVRTFQLTGVR